MARRSHRRHKKHTDSPLLELGVKALVAGIGMLVASAVLSSHALLAGAAAMLMAPAWLALGAGVVLLGTHGLRGKKNANKPADSPRYGAGLNTDTAADQNNAIPVWAQPRPFKNPPHWSAAVFAAIEWRRFEAVCEAMFEQAGFETRSQSHGADGGVDIWLHSKNADGPVSVVQCKHWQGKAVGVKEVREFLGVMASHGLKRGTYATTSTFTTDAMSFAKDNGISPLDGKALIKLITTQRTPEQQAALLNIAYEGEYWKPTCASCGIKMVERTPARGGAPFWGCKYYPRCKSRIYKAARA